MYHIYSDFPSFFLKILMISIAFFSSLTGAEALAADQQDLFKNRLFKKFLKKDTSLYT